MRVCLHWTAKRELEWKSTAVIRAHDSSWNYLWNSRKLNRDCAIVCIFFPPGKVYHSPLPLPRQWVTVCSDWSFRFPWLLHSQSVSQVVGVRGPWPAGASTEWGKLFHDTEIRIFPSESGKCAHSYQPGPLQHVAVTHLTHTQYFKPNCLYRHLCPNANQLQYGTNVLDCGSFGQFLSHVFYPGCSEMKGLLNSQLLEVSSGLFWWCQLVCPEVRVSAKDNWNMSLI